MKKVLSFIMAGLVALSMTACANKAEQTAQNDEQPTEAITEVSSEEEIGNMDEVPSSEKAILVVSFGTSYNDSREATIGAIENKIAEDFPLYDVKRAFTSEIIINKLKERDGLEIDTVSEAMEELLEAGYREVIVQPTHIMSGKEYDEIVEEVTPYEDKFDYLVFGKPLLSSDEDYENVINALTAEIPEISETENAVVLMGHGTEHEANVTYSNLADKLKEAGYSNVVVTTVESTPDFDDALAEVTALDSNKVYLYPFMIVAGDHANNDMAGDEEDSLKTLFKKNGFEAEPVLKGLGEYEGIREIYSEHVQAAIDSITEG